MTGNGEAPGKECLLPDLYDLRRGALHPVPPDLGCLAIRYTGPSPSVFGPQSPRSLPHFPRTVHSLPVQSVSCIAQGEREAALLHADEAGRVRPP